MCIRDSYEDYALLGLLNIVVARLQQTREKALNVFTYISGLGEHRGEMCIRDRCSRILRRHTLDSA